MQKPADSIAVGCRKFLNLSLNNITGEDFDGYFKPRKHETLLMCKEKKVFAAIVHNNNFSGLVNASPLEGGKYFFQYGLSGNRAEWLGFNNTYITKNEIDALLVRLGKPKYQAFAVNNDGTLIPVPDKFPNGISFAESIGRTHALRVDFGMIFSCFVKKNDEWYDLTEMTVNGCKFRKGTSIAKFLVI